MLYCRISRLNRCFFCLVVLVLGFNGLQAQGMSAEDEKKEIRKQTKEWRKKARYYKKNPLVLKAREEAFEAEREQIRLERERCQKSYSELDRILQSEKDQVRQELLSTKMEVDSMLRVEDSLRFAVNYLMDSLTEIQANQKLRQETQATTTQRQISALRRAVVGTDAQTAGVTYSVQIGAVYRGQSRVLPLSLENFIVDTTNGVNQYLVGRFTDRQTAESFRNEVRQFGIKDAFVVAFQDGQRITMRKAKKELKKQATPNQLDNRTKVELEELKERLKGLEDEKKRLQFQMDTVKSSRRQAQLELQRVQKLYEVTLREINNLASGYNPLPAEDDNARILSRKTAESDTSTYYYQVQLYSGSFAGAEVFKKKCKNANITEPIQIQFDKPYHKLRSGTFMSYQEALRYRDIVRVHFPDAFVVKRK